MNLLKKNVHMNRLKSHIVSQITLDDDFNVPDVNADIDKLVTKEGHITIESTKVQDGRVLVNGKMSFKLLYSCQDSPGKIHSMNGTINFSETIIGDTISESDSVNIKWDIDDLNVGVINTRKVSIKAIVTLTLTGEDMYDIEAANDIEDDDDIKCKNKSIDLTQIAVCKKDIYRIKEDLDLPAGKPNIANVLWDNVYLKSVSSKLLDEKIALNGELVLFLLYEDDEEDSPIRWIESTIPFNGNLEVPGCSEDMISDIEISINNSNISAKADYDGETRVIECDTVLELNMKIYREEPVTFVNDAYSPNGNLLPTYQQINYNSILIKNLSKCKVADKLKLDSSKGQVFQILSSSGVAKIDDITITENGLSVDGVVHVKLLYISSDDKMPLSIADEIIPYTHNVEAPGIEADSLPFIRPALEQLSTVMTGSNEIEVKAIVALDSLVLNNKTDNIIVDMELEPYDAKTIQDMPGIIAYPVKNDDTLWDIAKKFRTTTEAIMSINDLKSESLKPNDMLIVVRT